VAAVSPKSPPRPKLAKGGVRGSAWSCSFVWSLGSVEDGDVLALPERKRGVG
jgi:hypothetical protein